MTQRIDYPRLAPDAMKTMMALERYVRGSELEHSLIELVKLRASYMNGCAYCVDMHSRSCMRLGA